MDFFGVLIILDILELGLLLTGPGCGALTYVHTPEKNNIEAKKIKIKVLEIKPKKI